MILSPLRAVLLNQGAGGDAVLGHLTTEAILRPRLEGVEGLDVRFLRLSPLQGVARHAVRPVPGLAWLDADLQAFRWHVVQALRARRLLTAALVTEGADVVHLHSHVLGFALGSVMERVATVLSVDAPVWEVHAMGIWRPVRPWSRQAVGPSIELERRAFSRAAAVLAWSTWAREGVERISPRARVIDHHPGIDLHRYRPAAVHDPTCRRVLFVGGRFQQKGGGDLIAALAPALDRGDVRLDVVTKSEVPPRAGVTMHRLSGGDPELVALYQRCDVFCAPSHADACPWTVLEAMACGAAVVASDVGGTPELVDHGRAGMTVPAGDITALRTELEALLDDAPRRRLLGEAARRRVEERYDADRNAMTLVQLLRDVR